MKIGVRISNLKNAVTEMKRASEMGIHSCQPCCYDTSCYTDELAKELLEASKRYNIEFSAFSAGWSKPRIWNFSEGPLTLGLLPPAYRHKRIDELKRGSDFAAKIGIDKVITHAGFIPENPHDPLFEGMMDALREVGLYCRAQGQRFLFEAGQETPIALLRAFDVIGLDNLGVNLDTANLILYGKANPVDALEILKDYVYDLHIKDGKWPTNGWELGQETPVGEGKVDFPKIIQMLKEMNYQGTLTIEREITGEAQVRDILAAKAYLEKLLAEAK